VSTPEVDSAPASVGSVRRPCDDREVVDWDLMRFFLAVHRSGSMTAAAKLLGVDQTTVSRRIAALTQIAGVRLLERTPRGYELTEAGRAVAEHAGAAEESLLAAERHLAGRDERLEGPVCVTATETLSTRLLQALAGFRAVHPLVELDLVVTTRTLNLGRREADIALRMARPTEAELVVRHVADVALALYASQTYLRIRGTPKEGRLEGHDVLFFDQNVGLAHDERLLRAVNGGRMVFRTNGTLSLTGAAVAGLGIAALPCVLGDAEPILVRLGGPLTEVEVWLAAHREVKKAARMRAVYDYLAAFFRDLRPALAGRARN
jgi:DNA-binding transcriptional LysR family regulator